MIKRFLNSVFSDKFLTFSSTCLTGIIGILAISWWFQSRPPEQAILFTPGLDGRPENSIKSYQTVPIGIYFEEYNNNASFIEGEWPRFRGREYDNINKETIPLVNSFSVEESEKEPEILYRIALGEGHAAPAVMNSRIYILDYDEEKKGDALRCFSFDNGKELWRRWYPIAIKRNHGMSRTIPAVTEKYAAVIGPMCQVMCVDAITGDFLWGIDLEKEYNTKVPGWYTAQCPVIDNDRVVIAPSGTYLMTGVDCRTGDVIWKTPNKYNWDMSHSSIIPATIADTPMYIYSAIGGICGVGADEENPGEILWSTPAWNKAVVAPSPVVFPDGRIFLTAGYGAGSMMIRVKKTDGVFTVDVLYAIKPREGLSCEQQTPILYQGHLFGILTKDAGPLRNQFVCFDPENRIVWYSGGDHQFGLGPYILADDKFFILRDDGVLVIAKASLEGYKEISRAKILHGRDAWGPLVITNGRLLARDTKELVCVNIKIER